MTNKSTSVKAKSRTGEELAYHLHETDSPILPVAQLERLAKFKPEAVQWCIDQTQIEAEYRRNQQSRINYYIFISHVLGQLFGFLIGLAGIVGGSIVAINGQPIAGGTIATVAIGSLAAVFVTGRAQNHIQINQDE